MDVHGKTMDNVKSTMDIAYICDRKELYSLSGPSGETVKQKAKFVLTMDKRRELSEWMERLNMFYGYCSNFRNIMDNHDCPLFMETLLPIAFGALPDDVLKLLIEVSQFFRNLCSITLQEEMLKEMHQNIVVTPYKLETIFLPGFFNVIGHLSVYFTEDTQVSSPIQYLRMDISI